MIKHVFSRQLRVQYCLVAFFHPAGKYKQGKAKELFIMNNKFFAIFIAVALAVLVGSNVQAGEESLLNASYDTTRHLYKDYNPVFAKYWKDKTGDTVRLNQPETCSGM